MKIVKQDASPTNDANSQNQHTGSVVFSTINLNSGADVIYYPRYACKY